MTRRIRWVIGFLSRSEPRRPLTGWMIVCDAVIAAAATAGVLVQTLLRRTLISTLPAGTVFAPIKIAAAVTGGPWYAALWHTRFIAVLKGVPHPLAPAPPVPAVALAGIALTAAPLLFRRRFPVASAAVILAATILTRVYVPPLTFGTALFAAFCAVVYSRYRQLAVAVVLAGAIAATIAFPNTLPRVAERYTALIAVVPTVVVALGMRELYRRVGDSAARLRRAQAEHEAATVRALEHERARIAAELHDVVTHNVAVMIVQAGAARKVIGSAPGEAEQALLAVEAGGRTAMTELRNLLGLLCPARADEPVRADDPVRAEEAAELRPQPGLAGVPALADRVAAAGLDVTLTVTGTSTQLPPGPDLAAYRVVQEGLTNVIRHAGEAGVDVLIEWGAGLTITVSDDGPGYGPGNGQGGGGQPGRGLIGLRERLALYGGTLDAGPREGNGWRLRAAIPLPRVDDDLRSVTTMGVR
jgi:signal transduction histidine kinase